MLLNAEAPKPDTAEENEDQDRKEEDVEEDRDGHLWLVS